MATVMADVPRVVFALYDTMAGCRYIADAIPEWTNRHQPLDSPYLTMLYFCT